jgi:hypothetical protein
MEIMDIKKLLLFVIIFSNLFSSNLNYIDEANVVMSHGPIGYTSVTREYIKNFHLNLHLLPFVTDKITVGGLLGAGFMTIGTFTCGIEGRYYLYKWLSFNLLASYQTLKNNDFKFFYHYICISPGISFRIKLDEHREPIQFGQRNNESAEAGLLITINKGIILSSRTKPGRLAELMPPYLLNFELGFYSMYFK